MKTSIADSDLIVRETLNTSGHTVTFKKFDSDKPELERLMRFGILQEVCRNMKFGAEKYGDDNWRLCKKSEVGRYYGAALRHINSAYNGEEKDPESGLPHLAHAITCLLFITEIN